ncbi:MAG: hypothetical protein ACRDH7_09470 [Actinomycetota bacterium]
MKLRNVLLLVIGIAIGYKIAATMRQDDPNVVKGPRRESGGSRTVRTVSAQAQRLADQATTKSLQAIKKARVSLRDRMGDYESDDAVWN